jgi:uncharacterized membrane protein YoaK (UPF0700 family)
MYLLSSRDGLVVLLALTTGATDAAAFERLGNAFASVITGNLVLLGVGGARGDGRLALFSGCALAGYALGVFGAAPRRGEPRAPDGLWPRATTIALTVDLALLAIFALGWELAGGRPGRSIQFLLLALAAAAMGVQSAAIRRLGPLSTTYLTSTFIGVFEALAARTWSRDRSRSVAILLVALAGAAAGTALILYARRLLPLLQLAPLLIVLAASTRLTDRASSH